MLVFFSFRHLSWFQPSSVGGFPLPDRWPGWLVFCVLILAIASTRPLEGDLALVVRAGLCAAYVALSYATLSPD